MLLCYLKAQLAVSSTGTSQRTLTPQESSNTQKLCFAGIEVDIYCWRAHSTEDLTVLFEQVKMQTQHQASQDNATRLRLCCKIYEAGGRPALNFRLGGKHSDRYRDYCTQLHQAFRSQNCRPFKRAAPADDDEPADAAQSASSQMSKWEKLGVLPAERLEDLATLATTPAYGRTTPLLVLHASTN